jgi:hypothetical protein
MERRDLKRELKGLYEPSVKEVVDVTVPPMRFLMIDGQGDPNTSEEYSAAVEALFAVSYTVKFAAKKGPLAIDYGVMPLEGLWWAQDMSDFITGGRDRWLWTAMIMQPDFVTEELVGDSIAQAARKKSLPALDVMRFEEFDEGLAAQVMHVGPFSAEAPNIERVHAHIEESGRSRFGKHHEIYLTDIRRADPAKWKTVVRQPMR